MPALLARIHVGRRIGRHFILWHLLRWGFGGPAWHPILFLGTVGVIVGVALVIVRRRQGPPSRRRGGFRSDSSGRLDIDRQLEERDRNLRR